MEIELRPLGVNCNLGCQYCYQNPHRDAGQVTKKYDIEAMKHAIREEGADGFYLFGGEPLLMPISDLEELFAWGYETFGKNSVQTNAVLITEEHIALFHKYHVLVGISIDGPGELNDARWAGSQERTRQATQKTERAIEQLCGEGIVPNIMVQLNRCNATAPRLPRLLAWLKRLDAMGVRAMRIHVLENNNDVIKRHYGLSSSENIQAYKEIYELSRTLNMYIAEFNEIRRMLLAMDHEGPCVFRACDPYTTTSVRGVGGNGERHNCGLTDKEGINFLKPDQEGFERYIALYYTPHQYGGCKGCRFFLVCKGQCPGTGMRYDWRNRSENCEVWMALFEMMEQELVGESRCPVSLHPDRKQIEDKMVDAFSTGDNPLIADLMQATTPRSRDD